MTAYLLVEIEVLDPDTYNMYIERMPPVVRQYSGRYLVRGGDVVGLAGGWEPDRVIIVEFPSDAELYEFVTSDEYRALAPLRERSTKTRSIVLHGTEAQPQAAATRCARSTVLHHRGGGRNQ